MGMASPVMASIGALLVSAVYESTSDQRGDNKLVSIAPQCHSEAGLLGNEKGDSGKASS